MTIEEELKAMFDEDEIDDPFIMIKPGTWKSEGKYQYYTDIVQNEVTDKYYAIHSSRSGSYFTDYEYGETEVEEVKPVKVEITRYIAV